MPFSSFVPALSASGGELGESREIGSSLGSSKSTGRRRPGDTTRSHSDAAPAVLHPRSLDRFILLIFLRPLNSILVTGRYPTTHCSLRTSNPLYPSRTRASLLARGLKPIIQTAVAKPYSSTESIFRTLRCQYNLCTCCCRRLALIH